MSISSAEMGRKAPIALRPMAQGDAEAVKSMMRGFYASQAVYTNGSEAIFSADVEACLSNNPFLEGWVFESPNGLAGYAMLAKSFSTEFGCPCVWIEDLFLQEMYRNQGCADMFFAMLEEKYPNALLRLEAEQDNSHAVHVYQKNGFSELPYMEMMKNNRNG